MLSDNWEKYDVFILVAPTAFGKTAVAKTLMNCLGSVSVLTPSNMLVSQFLDEFPDTPTLRRLDSYKCEEWDRPCSITRGKLRNFCKPRMNPDGNSCKCPASADLVQAKFRRGPGIYNYHTYLAHKLYRDVLVVDEAHNLLPVIRERHALRLWQHDYGYPGNMWKPEQILEWIRNLPDTKRRSKKIQLLREACEYRNPTHMFERTTESFAGKGTIRGFPEDRDVIKLLPVDIRHTPPLFWPREVKKLVLMSATIGEIDVDQLGLGGPGRRICYINCRHPIPPQIRPIIPLDLVSVNKNNMEEATKIIGEFIQSQLLPEHTGERGIIHATYQQAELLRKYLTDSRFMFHTRHSKQEVFQQFTVSNPTEGKVLVASGLYEGIDLPDDLGRWQVLAKIPWLNLGNPAIRHLANRSEQHYMWECLKTVIQACGRISRHETDYGVTIILDSTFQRLYDKTLDIAPPWWLEAIVNSDNK